MDIQNQIISKLANDINSKKESIIKDRLLDRGYLALDNIRYLKRFIYEDRPNEEEFIFDNGKECFIVVTFYPAVTESVYNGTGHGSSIKVTMNYK